MSQPTRYKFSRISQSFNRVKQKPRIDLKQAFQKSHRVPQSRTHFRNASRDQLKPKHAKPSLTLTPSGARSVRAASRRSVAERKINPRKLPNTRAMRTRPVREQFRAAGRRNGKSSGRGR